MQANYVFILLRGCPVCSYLRVFVTQVYHWCNAREGVRISIDILRQSKNHNKSMEFGLAEGTSDLLQLKELSFKSQLEKMQIIIRHYQTWPHLKTPMSCSHHRRSPLWWRLELRSNDHRHGDRVNMKFWRLHITLCPYLMSNGASITSDQESWWKKKNIISFVCYLKVNIFFTMKVIYCSFI